MNETITLTMDKALLDSVAGALRDMGEAISEDMLPGADDHVAWALYELERALATAARGRGYFPKATALGGRLHEAETRAARMEAEIFKLRCTIDRITRGLAELEESVEAATEEAQP